MQALIDYLLSLLEKLLVYFLIILAFLEQLFAAPLADPSLPIEQVEKDLGIDVSQGVVLENWDTHGGFLGDGLTYVSIRFTPEQAPEDQMQPPYWHALPLSQNLDTVLYSGRFLRNAHEERLFPPIKNGFYYFRDRNSKSVDDTDDTPLFSQGSYNFTLAVYDSDAKTLHYIAYDT